ncbi:MAG: hypothetical protein QOE35_3374 [Actinomycetota bacterium]|jgi:hypothetical protein
MVVAGRRRRRRPRWLVLVILLALSFVAVRGMASSGSDSRSRRLAEQAYLDEMRPVVERSTQEGADLVAARGDAGKLGRVGVTRRLAQLQDEAAGLLRDVHGAHPPSSLASAHSLLESTMFIRSRAVGGLAASLPEALAAEGSGDVVKRMATAGADLETADGIYAVFRRSLAPPGGTPAASMPPSRWVPRPGFWSEGELRALVSTLRANSTLAPVHDVAVIVVSTNPTAVGKEGEADVLPPSKTLRLEVVVANVGNTREKQVPVVAAITTPTGAMDTARQFVDLAPGQRLTVTLGGLQPTRNEQLSLGVRAGPVAGESNVADNEIIRALLVRG